MAERPQIMPEHRPHDQLRTAPAAQRPHTDKYVSCFEPGTPSGSLTFRNPILDKSADHFKVGIDELTANIGALSMLEYESGEILFRIERRGYDGDTSVNKCANTADTHRDTRTRVQTYRHTHTHGKIHTERHARKDTYVCGRGG